MNSVLVLTVILSVFGFLQVSPTFPKKGYGPGEQEWGHIDVRQGAHMFYWLYYVQDPGVASFYDRPLVIWLHGVPGSSSTGFGNFEEVGPLFLNGTARPSSWAEHVNLLFVDNPVGMGFSYVDDEKFLTRTNPEIGRDMVAFLTSFYKTYPEFEKTPLYIFSESYGGKMAVEIAKQLVDAIKDKKVNINFKGVGLGNSLISPVDSVNAWGPFLFYTNFIDEGTFDRLKEEAKEVQNAVNKGDFGLAFNLFTDICSLIQWETVYINFYNIFNQEPANSLLLNERKGSFYNSRSDIEMLMNGPVRKALGISKNIVYNLQSDDVYDALIGDFMKPVVDVVEDLLNNSNLQIVVYNGNFDLIVPTVAAIKWTGKMGWKGATQWKTATREPLILNRYVKGYVKSSDNLYLYWVNRAGHMVPTDNPEVALEILRRTTNF